MDNSHPGRSLLIALKETAGAGGPPLVFPVSETGFHLRPVAVHPDALNAHDIELLTDWRNLHVNSFLTRFEATTERTAAWLSNSVRQDDSRILFMLEKDPFRPCGYLGLAFINWEKFSGEADAIVRGGPAPKGTMTTALHTLMSFATGSFGLKHLGVRVLSDNPALHFYEKAGFKETRRTPLTELSRGEETSWVESSDCNNPALWLVHHTYHSKNET